MDGSGWEARDDVQRELDRVRRVEGKLWSALRRFGCHLPSCPKRHSGPCDCGFDAILAGYTARGGG